MVTVEFVSSRCLLRDTVEVHSMICLTCGYRTEVSREARPARFTYREIPRAQQKLSSSPQAHIKMVSFTYHSKCNANTESRDLSYYKVRVQSS